MKSRIIFSSATVEWPTPQGVYDALNREFAFDFDPCPTNGDADGLATLLTPWAGRRVFCNPPYGPKIREWLARAPEAELAVFLIPARTDTRWFHELVLPCAKEIRFIRGRLKFGNAKTGAPFPSMVVVFEAAKEKAS
jgi:site-specific DNA-methyltransferase (adenine-specific)